MAPAGPAPAKPAPAQHVQSNHKPQKSPHGRQWKRQQQDKGTQHPELSMPTDQIASSNRAHLQERLHQVRHELQHMKELQDERHLLQERLNILDPDNAVPVRYEHQSLTDSSTRQLQSSIYLCWHVNLQM